MKIQNIFILLIISTLSFFAQDSIKNNCVCCSEKHSQFDFWVGEWTVYDTLDNYIGTNKIIKQYENCLIQENWISGGKNRGTSYNYYDPTDSTWNQLWLDNQGTILKLKGSFINGEMVLKSPPQKGKKVEFYFNRITWSKLMNGNVIQTWDILDEEDNVLTNLFKGVYKPKLN